MAGPVLSVSGLTKRFRRFEALVGVNLSVEPGTVFSLLGQNGAGKTTLIKVLLGILKPSEGTAQVLGFPVGSVQARRKIGYLPEDHRFPEYHTGPSLLEFYGALQGIPRQERRKRIGFWLDRVGLGGRETVRIRGYSKGMKQRIGIAQALIHDPDLIFLDEPTDGVDPVGRREIRDLMLDLKRMGKTLFLNSHLLGEVELVSDRVAILNKGKMVREGSLTELTGGRPSWIFGFAGNPIAFRQNLLAKVVKCSVMENPGATPPHQWEVFPESEAVLGELVKLAGEDPAGLRFLQPRRESLEDVYLKSLGQREAVSA